MKLALCVLTTLMATPALAGATGRVVGPDGAAITGAEVCETADDGAETCVAVDAAGVFRIQKPARPRLLVRAPGYVATMIDAAPLTAPVQLQKAAVLEVTIVDAATRKPVPSGKVILNSPSGKRIGSFVPFNKQGVRISTLEPGDLFVRVEADGYEPSGPVP